MHQTAPLIEELELADQAILYVINANNLETQAALTINIAAGSHDEPTSFLGLAHYLEHMVFRGSANFHDADTLMSFVQNIGGQVNAQTQAHYTSFHLQINQSALLDSTKRLVDMLVYPSFTQAALKTERQVIEQEFQLYQQHPASLKAAAISLAIDPPHALRFFHCGNNRTLALENSDFSLEFKAFHQRAYQRSLLKIVLVCNPDYWYANQTALLQQLEPLLAHSRKPNTSAQKRLNLQFDRWIYQQVTVQKHPEFIVHLVTDNVVMGNDWLTEVISFALNTELSAIVTRARNITFSKSYQSAIQTLWRFALEFDEFSAVKVKTAIDQLQQWLKHLFSKLNERSYQHFHLSARVNRWLMQTPLQKALQYAELPLCLSEEGLAKNFQQSVIQPLQSLIILFEQHQFLIHLVNLQPVSESINNGLSLQAELLDPPKQERQHKVITEDQQLFSNCATSNKSLLEPISQWLQPIYQSLLAQGTNQAILTGYFGWAISGNAWVVNATQSLTPQLNQWLSYNGAQCEVFLVGQMLFVKLEAPQVFFQQAATRMLYTLSTNCLHNQHSLPEDNLGLRAFLQQLPKKLRRNTAKTQNSFKLNTTPETCLLLGLDSKARQLYSYSLNRPYILQQTRLTSSKNPHLVSASTAGNNKVLLIALNFPYALAERCIAEQVSQPLLAAVQQRLRVELGVCYAMTCYIEHIDNQGYLCIAVQSAISSESFIQEVNQQLTHVISQLTASDLLKTLKNHQIQLNLLNIPLAQLQQTYFNLWIKNHKHSELQTEYLRDVEALAKISHADLKQFLFDLSDHSFWSLYTD